MIMSLRVVLAAAFLTACRGQISQSDHSDNLASRQEAKDAVDAKQSKMSAVDKVVGMMEDLKQQVIEEGDEEARSYAKYACWAKDTMNEKIKVMTDARAEMGRIEAAKGDAEGVRDTADGNIATEQGNIRMLETQLKEEKDTMAAMLPVMNANIEAMEKNLEMVDAAIKILKQSSLETEKRNLLQIPVVRKSLELASVLAPNSDARKNYASLLQEGPTYGDEMVDDESYRTDYEFKAGDVIGTLGSIRETVVDDLKTQTDYKRSQEHAHQMKVQKLTDDLTTAQSNLEDAQRKREEARKSISDLNSQWTEQNAIDLDAQEYALALEKMAKEKRSTYRQRSNSRLDEITALTTATLVVSDAVGNQTSKATLRLAQQNARVQLAGSIISSPEAMKAIEFEAEEADARSPSFLQSSKFLAKVETPESGARKMVVALLATQGKKLGSTMLMELATQIKADPFAKVKSMIQDLITKLNEEMKDEQAAENEYKKNRNMEQLKLDEATARISELDAALAENNARRDQLMQDSLYQAEDVLETRKSLTEATEQRDEEKRENAETVLEAEVGVNATKKAIEILREYYDGHNKNATANKDAAHEANLALHRRDLPGEEVPDAGFESGTAGEYHGAGAESGGIVGMLEVILSDFERTISETEAAEKEAETVYLDFAMESEITIKKKGIIILNNKEELGELNTDINDQHESLVQEVGRRASASNELTSLYKDHYESGQTYEERKAFREQEIAALKRAHCILDSYQKFGPEGSDDRCTDVDSFSV